MAPEQARGQTPTPASDVYGAGVVLYEMLAGRPPFTERSAVELALRHASDPPPPLPGHVPQPLEEVVSRALAKDPGARYQSAGEMADALASAGLTPGITREAPDATREASEATCEETDASFAATPQGPGRAPAATRVAPRRGPRRTVNPAESRRYRALWALALLVLAGLILGAVLSAGGNARVPALAGLRQDRARAKLRHADLHPQFSRRYARAPAETVIAEHPAAGTRVSDGSTVRVVLSAGPPPVPVPQLLGQRSADAQAILSRLGLTATITAVAAPGVTPGLVVQQSPAATKDAARGSQVRLLVAETPRWRPLRSFSGDGSGQSGVFRIRGRRWRIVYTMGYDGTCNLIFFCSGPTAQITNASTGGAVDRFDLNDGDGQTRVLSAGPGVYEISVTPGSDGAHWQLQIQDDY
jgi:serine/threonine-protein kinase